MAITGNTNASAALLDEYTNRHLSERLYLQLAE